MPAVSLTDTALAEIVGRIRLIAFDFDGVFTDNAVYVFEDGREAVRCVRSDGIGLRKLDRLGIQSVIISTESNPVVAARSRKLNIRCIQNCEDKRAALDAVRSEMNLDLDRIAFVGNDVNDEPCLACVALPIVVQDAHPDVVKYAQYVTSARGGYGAVREICDLFERLLNKGMSKETTA
ncbi:MAG TPA: HAD hydrolase family protein [Thermoanaerobaculia bacterium]|nr:HAD hydrolase family protein [Thermoanaerobaculia bacterium]